MLTVTMEVHKEEPHMNTKTSPSLPNIIQAQEVKKKIWSMNRSADLQSIYLQQFKQYPLPLILLKKGLSCWSPQPSLPKYNPVPYLEEAGEVHPEEAEEAHQEEGASPEEEMPIKPLREMGSPWVHYPPYLKEIAQKLRAFSKSSPHTLLTMMFQCSPLSSKELLLPSHVLKGQKSIDGHSNNLNCWWPYNQPMIQMPRTNSL